MKAQKAEEEKEAQEKGAVEEVQKFRKIKKKFCPQIEKLEGEEMAVTT